MVVGCDDPSMINEANKTPVADDFEIDNLTQIAGSVTAVTVTSKSGKSAGAITVLYNGSTTLPTAVGTYTVTFDVVAVTGWNSAYDLYGGVLRINAGTGNFPILAAINITYEPMLMLANLPLPSGYAWNIPATVLNAGNEQSFPAMHTDPSGNYETASGNITVNVAKAAGVFGNPAVINTVYTSTLTLANLALPTGYTWNIPATVLNAGDGEHFPATYTDPSGNYETASGNIVVNVSPRIITFIIDAIALQIYTGHEICPAITVKDGSIILTLNADYSVLYSDNTNAGTATVTITGLGNYAGSSGTSNFTILQTVSGNRFEYYWVDQHGSLVTTSGGISAIAPGETLTITAQGSGYIVKQWHLNGVNTGRSGNTYIFSSDTMGIHTVGLFVEKDGRLYNTNITITVQ